MEWTTLLNPEKERKVSSVTKTSNDARSPFKVDFDTVCNCTGIRRLQDKAQVFPLEKGDYARTRFTHSIEVMSIAESLGVHAIKVIQEKSNPSPELMEQIKEIPVILRTAALLHDMGNPPFGHLGEGIIGEWFQTKLDTLIVEPKSKKVIFSDNTSLGVDKLVDKLSEEQKCDLRNFEGNAQLLRLITKLNYVVDSNGMNLTYPVLATIIKYPCSSLECEMARKNKTVNLLNKKPGYYTTEKKLYERIDSTLGLNKKRFPLTFLLEAADDIAYLTADIEDAHKKGIISFNTIANYFISYNKENEDPFVQSIINEIGKYREQGLKQGITDIDNYIMQRLRIFIKGNMISKAMDSFNENYNSIMNGSYSHELLDDSEAKAVVQIIKNNIEKKHIYYCPEIVKSKIKSYKILTYILDALVPCVFNAENEGQQDDKDSLIYNLLSDNYRFICNNANRELNINGGDYIYNKLLLVTDFVSGMTDSYAKDLYELLVSKS